MPQLPSGRHFAVDFDLGWLASALDELTPSGIVATMSVKSVKDLEPYTRLLWLTPKNAEDNQTTPCLQGSLTPPADLTPMWSGRTMATLDELASETTEDDMTAIREFLQSDRFQQTLKGLFEDVVEVQEELVRHPNLTVRTQAAWAKMDVHPLQTGESEGPFWKGAFEPPGTTSHEETP